MLLPPALRHWKRKASCPIGHNVAHYLLPARRLPALSVACCLTLAVRSCFRCLPAAGATSAALKKNNSGLTKKLSGFASFAALALGATMLLGGFGVELPFSLPFGLGHEH